MFSAFTPSPIAHWLTAIPVRSPRAAAASDSADVLDVDMAHFAFEPLQEGHRVLTGDERVARVHVHSQAGRVGEGQHLLHERRAWW